MSRSKRSGGSSSRPLKVPTSYRPGGELDEFLAGPEEHERGFAARTRLALLAAAQAVRRPAAPTVIAELARPAATPVLLVNGQHRMSMLEVPLPMLEHTDTYIGLALFPCLPMFPAYGQMGMSAYCPAGLALATFRKSPVKGRE
jgi:hypothetical protein